MAKLAADALTVFTVDAESLLCHTNEVEYEVTAEDEDGACINESDDFPLAVSRARTITASGNLNNLAMAVSLMEGASLNVPFVLNAGSVTISGNALMTLGSVRVARKSLQNQRFQLKVQGQPTITLPDD